MVKNPTVVLPTPNHIENPIDIVRAALNAFVSARLGLKALEAPLPEKYTWIAETIGFIENGDERFARTLVKDLMSGEGDDTVLSVGITYGSAASLDYKKGNEIEAWRKASYSALLLGIATAAQWDGVANLNAAMKAISNDGTERRHAKNRELREFAVGKYRASRWASANDAAHRLKDEVAAEGERIGVRLSKQNAQRTLAEWFRAADKKAQPL